MLGRALRFVAKVTHNVGLLDRSVVKLWVDDERRPPRGWYWATTSDEAIDVLASCQVEEMSLDHDLGSGGTGYEVVVWLEEQEMLLGLLFWPERACVHSMNSVGRDNMLVVLEKRYLRTGRRRR